MNKKDYYESILKDLYEESIERFCEALKNGDSEKRKYYEDRIWIVYSCLADYRNNDINISWRPII